MSAIRLLVITIFMALLVLILGNGRDTQAAPAMEPELEPVTRPFDHIANQRLAAAASGADGCDTVAQDEAQYRFDLPVTADVRADLVAALSGGGSSGVAFQTETTFLIEGGGSAEFTADFKLIIFDDSSGSETVLQTWHIERQATESGPATERYTHQLAESVLDQLQVGDILRVQGTAQAVARSGGCQSTDRAAAATKPIDKATPLLHISFTNCDSLGLAGTAYVTGLNCRLLALEEYPRAYLVYVPETVQDPAAVVFMFHGSSGNGSQYYNISGWTEKADAEGFYAVYPTALKYCNRSIDPESCNWATKWNSYKLPEEEGFDFDVRPPGDPDKGPDWRADDVGFTRAVVADLEGAGGLIGPFRFYASGFSNGASFVGRLAVEMADVFAAVGYTSAGLVKVSLPENQPPQLEDSIPIYAAIGTDEDGLMEVIGGDPATDVLPLAPAALLATCGLVDYFIRPHLDTLGHDYDPHTLWPYSTLENEHSTLFRWDASLTGDPEHLFLLEVMEGVEHTYPKGFDGEKNPYGFNAVDMFWTFFQNPVGYFDIAPVSPESATELPECPADPPTGDYGDAPDDSNTPGINPNTAYTDTGVSGRFPTTWPAPAPAGPVHFAPTVFLGDDFSLEAAADAGPDPDGANNIVDGPADNADNDAFDDGWLNPEALFPHCERTTVKVRISRASLASGGEVVPNQMYLNVWFDGNRDGDWQDRLLCPNVAVHPWAAEWIVRNRPVNTAAIAPGGFVDADVHTFRVPNQAEDLSHWLRFTLSEAPMPTPAGQMPDGRGPQGGFQDGESEDYDYTPPVTGAPGDLVVTQEANPVGPFVPGQVTDIVIGLEHVGGDGPAASQIRSVLPAGLSFVGPIGVEVEGQDAAPLLATYDEEQDLIAWDGRIAPGSKLLISFPVRVGFCFLGGDINLPIIAGVTALDGDGNPITAETTLMVNCSTATIDDISVERKLFVGDQQVMPGDNGHYIILDGADDSVSLQTSVTNNGDKPVLLGLAEVIEFKQGNDLLTGPAMEPAVEKTERFILLPIFGGETRNFAGNDPLRLFNKDGTEAALFGEAAIVSRLTICLVTFKEQTCPDPAGNPELAVEEGPINMLFARRDLGDAPDSSNNFAQPMSAYPGVPANFPTVRNPATGLPPGPVHIAPRPFHLGQRVSLEIEADINLDQDPSNNILPPPNVANRDRADDGIQPWLLNFNHCQPVTFQARVFISPAAVAYYANLDADGLAYLNAWLDGNGDGDWDDALDCPPEAPEHIVIDQVIDPVALGAGLQTINVTSGPVPWAGNDCAWLRLTLSDRPAEKPLTIGAVSYGDGRGADAPYVGGETEDHLLCPGGPGAPDLDIQVAVRPTFPSGADDLGASGDALMEEMRHFELLATFSNLGSATAAGAKLSITLEDGYSVSSATYPHHDGLRVTFHCATPTECSVDLDDLEPGGSGVLYMQVSGPLVTGPAPTAQFEVSNGDDVLLSNNSVTLPLEQEQPLFAPTINSALCNNEVIEGCFGFVVQGTAQPGSTVETTLERLDPAGQLSGETTADADGLWSLTIDNLPQGEYRAYAVTRSGDGRSPRSNALRWDVAPMRIAELRLTNEAGQQRIFNLSDKPTIKLTPGETYQIAVTWSFTDPAATLLQGAQLSWFLPDINNEVLLLDEDGDGIYTGQFTVPADQDLLADEAMVSTTFQLSLVSGGAEVIRQGQVILDGTAGRVFDSETGQPLSAAEVTALGVRPGLVHSRSLTLRQPWLGALFNHPNPLSTGDDGAYRFLTPEGEYHLRVRRPGYQPFLSALVSCVAPLCGGVLSEPLGLTREIAGPAAVLLTIADRGIYPAVVTIQAGQVVEWVNMDLDLRGVSHGAPAAADGLMALGDWHSGLLEPGQSYKRRFNRAGVYTIFDEANPASSMTVVVEEATIFLPVVVQ